MSSNAELYTFVRKSSGMTSFATIAALVNSASEDRGKESSGSAQAISAVTAAPVAAPSQARLDVELRADASSLLLLCHIR